MIQQEGPGWRLGLDPSRPTFTALIGGEGWAFELTENEWHGLVTLLLVLTEQHAALQAQLMAEEAIELEMERDLWWGCLDGDRTHWRLQVVLQSAPGCRGLEAHWPAPAAQAFVAAMRTAWDSRPDQQD
ncbi:MAG: DUF1818 family protein [Synechococcus sp.]